MSDEQDTMLSKHILPSGPDDIGLKHLTKDLALGALEDVELNDPLRVGLRKEPVVAVFPKGMGFPYSWMDLNRRPEEPVYPLDTMNGLPLRPEGFPYGSKYDYNIQLLSEALAINPNL